jgi:hypothetical protein
MNKTLTDRHSVDILSRLLAEENLSIVHNSSASTASFNPIDRVLTFPTYGDQISTDTQTSLALHETGHATDSPNGDKTKHLFKKYGRSLVNILEDVRIEKIVKEKFPGSKKFFARGYDELVLKHNFFGTAANENPFDFNDFGFLDRVNCHFKIGAKAMVKFNEAEQALVDEIDNIRTLDDLEAMANKLKEIAEENANTDNHQDFDGDSSESGDYEESDDEDFGEGSDPSNENAGPEEGDSGSDSSDEEGDEEGEGSGSSDEEGDDGSDEAGDSDEEGASGSDGDLDDSDSDDGDEEADGETSSYADTSADDGEDLNEHNESNDANEADYSDDDSDPSGDAVDLTEDDLEESETERVSRKALETLARNAGMVGHLPKSVDIPDIAQPWSEIEPWVDSMYDHQSISWSESMTLFRQEVKPVLNKMVAEFNRQAAGTVSRRTSYKDTGVLDPMKMVHYKYNDNIFKKRKFIRDGKNHGVVLFVDFTGSMCRRIVPVMRQVVLMVEFCKKVNIPFRVYGWSDMYLPSSDKDFRRPRTAFGTVGITEVLSSEMSSATLEKFLKWALSGQGMTPGGSTPIVSAFYHTVPLVRKFRHENSVDVVKMMFFTDGDGGTQLPDWGASSWIDSETGTQYSKSEMLDSFYGPDHDGYKSEWSAQQDQQMYFISRVLKDRYNVETVFMYMNYSGSSRRYFGGLNSRLRNGMFVATEVRKAKKSLKENNIAKVTERGSYTFIAMTDGYDIAPKNFTLTADSDMTQAQLKRAFLKATVQRKSSILFAELVAESLAE